MKANVLFLAALFAYARAEESATEAANSDVVVLTKDSFKDFAAKPLSLIEFYAPWCGHCKALAPEYEKAATELKEEIPIAKVDCTVETDVCQEQGVQGYPTLKVFRNGAGADYKGQRKADSIVSYMKKQALPALSVLEADKVDDFAASDKVVVVGFFEDTDSKDFKAFNAVAEKFREEYLFGYTTDKSAAKKHSAKAPAVLLFKKFDEGKDVFDGKLTEDEITGFVKSNSVPLMDDIGPENYNAYVDAGLPIAYLFTANDEDRKTFGSIVEPLAKKYKGKISFVYIDAVKYGGHGKNLNLRESWPAFAIQDPVKQLKYVYDQNTDIAEKTLATFLEDYAAGKVEPSLKSAPIPETNDEPVKVVVGKSYEDIVNDKTKDVLIEFYAPWCGHCKKLAPTYDELGAHLSSNSNIVIAKMDATENDVPPNTPFQIEGFPTIKLVKADTNEVVDYSGSRSLESLVEFIRDNAVNGKDVVLPEKKEEEKKEEAPAAEKEEHDEL